MESAISSLFAENLLPNTALFGSRAEAKGQESSRIRIMDIGIDGSKNISKGWIEFRVGHSGDAASLAALLTKCQFQCNQSHKRKCDHQEGGDVSGPTPTPPSNFVGTATTNTGCHTEQKQESDGSTAANAKPDTDAASLSVNRHHCQHHTQGEDSPGIGDGCSELELRLSSGFGDEQTPPAFHAILAEICSVVELLQERPAETKENVTNEEDGSSTEEKEEESNGTINRETNKSTVTAPEVTRELCGVAIATIDWHPRKSLRYLRVEEMAIDDTKVSCCRNTKDLLLRRFILSLSALALKTNCGGLSLKNGDVCDLKRNSFGRHGDGGEKDSDTNNVDGKGG